MTEQHRRNAIPNSYDSSLETLVASGSFGKIHRSRSMYEMSDHRNSPDSSQTTISGHPSATISPIISPTTLSPSNCPLQTNETSILFRPVPVEFKALCRLIRRKADSSLHPEYEMLMERSSNISEPRFMFSAKRKSSSRSYCYQISRNRLDDPDFENGIVAHVRSNFLGTLFTIHDVNKVECHEQAAVLYEPNLFGLKGPRKLTILLPGVTKEDKIRILPFQRGKCKLNEQFKSPNAGKMIILKNKQPFWNEDTQSYILNFQNRVSLASIKNFQLIPSFDYDYIVMQFGRIGLDSFTLDFQYPMTGLQAFGIALTSFEPKLACE